MVLLKCLGLGSEVSEVSMHLRQLFLFNLASVMHPPDRPLNNYLLIKICDQCMLFIILLLKLKRSRVSSTFA